MEANATQALQEGELYVVRNGELQHLERAKNDLPKVPVSIAAHERVLDLRRRCRRMLSGFRPDIALVASALLEHAATGSEAESIVAAYFYTMAARQASSLQQSAA
jgi:hypothetical protein